MGYYIRVLGIRNRLINCEAILTSHEGIEDVEIEGGTAEAWTQIAVKNADDLILTVEKNVIETNSLGEEELEEFSQAIEDCLPKSAAVWLDNYFDQVKVIYAIRILSAAYKNDNWGIVGSVQEAVWKEVGGILQSDGEGFTNEAGYHILWQFDNEVEGMYGMAILNDRNEWESFEMDLGSQEHRKLFKSGMKVTN